MVFDKSAKTTQWGQNSSRTLSKTVYIHAEKIEVGPLPYITYKNLTQVDQRPNHRI